MDIDRRVVFVIIFVLFALIIASVGVYFFVQDKKTTATPPPLPPIDDDTDTGFEDGPRPKGSTNIWTNIYKCDIHDESQEVIGTSILGITVLDQQNIHIMALQYDGKPQGIGGLFTIQMANSGVYFEGLYKNASSFLKLGADGIYRSSGNVDVPVKMVVEDDGKFNLKIGVDKNGDDYQWEYLWPLMKPNTDAQYDSGANVNQTMSGCHHDSYGVGQIAAEFMVIYKQNDYMVPGKENTYVWPRADRIHVLRTFQNNTDIPNEFDGQRLWTELSANDRNIVAYHVTPVGTSKISCSTNTTDVSSSVFTCDDHSSRIEMERVSIPTSAALKQAKGVCMGGFVIPLSRQEYLS